MGAIAEALLEYVQPLLDQTDGSEEQINKALLIGQLCWSLALLPEEQRGSSLDEFQSKLGMDQSAFDDMRRGIIEPMVQRYHEMFALPHPDRRSQADPDVAPRGEKYAGTERYAPCPCSSGRKYKFCCGKKSR